MSVVFYCRAIYRPVITEAEQLQQIASHWRRVDLRFRTSNDTICAITGTRSAASDLVHLMAPVELCSMRMQLLMLLWPDGS